MKQYLVLGAIALAGSLVGVMLAMIVSNHTAASAPTTTATTGTQPGS